MKSNSSPDMRRILVVEDEPDIAELIRLHLCDLPAQVCVSLDGELGLRMAMAEQWSAVLLDIRLPGMNGLDICKALRESGNQVPVLMLTSRNTELDRVLGLELGADDYLVKPFGVMELQARVKALWRRASFQEKASEQLKSGASTELCQGALRMDKNQRRCWVEEQDLNLTQTEFDLLWHFASQPTRVFSRSELLSQVWGYGHDGYEHTVNTHINRLRSKLGGDYIQTVWGVGYRFEAEQ